LLFLSLTCLPAIAQPKATDTHATILVLGDSLSAAYQIPASSGWVHLLTEQLAISHPDYRVINASISGETSSGGRTRLPALLEEHHPSLVMIELGANDGLRGYPITSFANNLEFMIRESQRANADVLLIGMQIPPNYGRRYTQGFDATYTRLAEQYKLSLVPFLLAGVADNDALLQADRLHPTAEAQPVLLNNVWPYLKPLLKSPGHASSKTPPKR
jgi:acyl-CoA thioesterase-1